jgi:hypothetical protein
MPKQPKGAHLLPNERKPINSGVVTDIRPVEPGQQWRVHLDRVERDEGRVRYHRDLRAPKKPLAKRV